MNGMWKDLNKRKFMLETFRNSKTNLMTKDMETLCNEHISLLAYYNYTTAILKIHIHTHTHTEKNNHMIFCFK